MRTETEDSALKYSVLFTDPCSLTFFFPEFFKAACSPETKLIRLNDFEVPSAVSSLLPTYHRYHIRNGLKKRSQLQENQIKMSAIPIVNMF